MGLRYIREHYKVPATEGGRIRDAHGNLGTILRSRGPEIEVQMDGATGPICVHPNSIEYLGA